MRTIDELKHSYNAASAKNQLTLCFRIDSRWADVVGSEPDCSDFFSIIMVEQGNVCVGINYHKTLLTPGDLLIVTPRTMLDIQKISPDFKAYHLAVDQSSFEGMLSMESAYRHLVMFYTSSPVPVLHSTDKAQEVMVNFMDQLDHLMQCAVTNVYIDKMMLLVEQALMLQLVNILPEHFDREVVLSHQEEIFRQFIDLLMTHYRSEHNSSFYSDRLHISNSYLARILKQIAGRGVKEFIFALLKKDAEGMLKYTDKSVGQIADDLGFPDITTFSRFFNKVNGVPPLAYRQSNHPTAQMGRQ